MRIGRHDVPFSLLAVPAVPIIVAGAALSFMAFGFPEFFARYQSLWTPLVVLTTAGVAILTAIVGNTLSSEMNMNVQKVKTTFDMIHKNQWDNDHIKARDLFVKAVAKAEKEGGTPLAHYIDVDDDDYAEIREISSALRNILNEHELTAVAIRENVLSENFYKLWFRSSYVKDYDLTKGYIDAVRDLTGNRRVFGEFETRAQSWKAEIAREAAEKPSSAIGRNGGDQA